MSSHPRMHAGVVVVVLACLAGCTVPIAVDLDESAANRVVEALERDGVVADKVVDSRGEGRWRIEVARSDASAAVSVLAREHLPPPGGDDRFARLDDGAIIPSRASEQARLLAATAAELEQSLTTLDSIVSARVHLAVPEPDPLRPARAPGAPSASVLLSTRSDSAGLSEPRVRELVAGAVAGLSESRVVVVTVPAPTPAPRLERQLTRFGPITTTRASAGRLRAAAIGLTLLDLILAALLVFMWARVRRLRSASAAPEAAQAPR